jgi:hypothetical protein
MFRACHDPDRRRPRKKLQTRIFRSVSKGDLTSTSRVIFIEILEEREPSHWTPHRRRIAAVLARTMYAVQRGQGAITREGFVTVNGRGNPEVHPNVRAVTNGINLICGYRRSLAIHARALGGEARDIARRREIALQHQRNAPDFDSELFARPNVAELRRRKEKYDD